MVAVIGMQTATKKGKNVDAKMGSKVMVFWIVQT